MRPPALFRRIAVASAALFPALAHAHPGHDGGHDLTWDFTGEVVHHLSSPYHVVPLLVAAAAFVLVLRLAKTRGASARKSRDVSS